MQLQHEPKENRITILRVDSRSVEFPPRYLVPSIPNNRCWPKTIHDEQIENFKPKKQRQMYNVKI